MTCPICGGKTTVTNSRATVDCVYRQRTCNVCKKKFYTEEVDCDEITFANVNREYVANIKNRKKKI